MWIRELGIENIRSFAKRHSLVFSKNINIFVGQNNSGKSTLLKAIYLLQTTNILRSQDVSLTKPAGQIELFFSQTQDYIARSRNGIIPSSDWEHVICHFNRQVIKRTIRNRTASQEFSRFPDVEPHNLIYPYLSKRKVTNFNESINQAATNSVRGDFHHLIAKIVRLCNVHHPKSEEYDEACKDIIGFPISSVASESGHIAAYITGSFSGIPLASMGEGVPNLLGLIVDLCLAENKVFLIEELENDIHPKALKALLSLIEKKSENNQFFISTHSNIVTKFLGSVKDSKVFKVSMNIDKDNRIPKSEVIEIENETNSRIELLEDLGYEPFDFGQWKAWLILEESSAEVIVRDFLIPTFVPRLKYKLRTYSARSLSEVGPKFKDFNNLFVFIHLEEIYKNMAWVVVDAGENEEKIIQKMRDLYSRSGWNEENFTQFREHDFERYFPERFQTEVDEILGIPDKNEKWRRKKQLIEDVKNWIGENPDEAEEGFRNSAGEIIEILKTIDRRIG